MGLPPPALGLAIAYSLLAAYGSLYPFSGWRDSGVPLTAFLTAGWPRYATAFDMASNLAAYLPLGFLWVAALRPRLPAVAAVLAASLLGGGLSLALETLQNFLPSRVPSNLDLSCNAAGALLGALAGMRWGATLFDGGRLHAWRMRWFRTGRLADTGLALLGLWLLTAFNPDTLLFGNGDLRDLLELPAPLAYSAGRFAGLETAIVAGGTLAAGLFATLLARRQPSLVVVALLVAAVLARSFAQWLAMSGSAGLAWATPGSLFGLLLGLLSWNAALRLPGNGQRAVAALSLLLATTLVNLSPVNPYLANTLQVWNPGQFLHFHGLTRLVSNLWPFLALPWLIMTRSDDERDESRNP